MSVNTVCWHVWGTRQEKGQEYWAWLAVDAKTAAWASAHLIPTLLLEPWRARLAKRIAVTRNINGERQPYDATAADGVKVLNKVSPSAQEQTYELAFS